jgi:hypothetical protein
LVLANAMGGSGRFVSALAICLLIAGLSWRAGWAEGEVSDLIAQIHWGESSQELLRHYGGIAVRLPRNLDFGDSYTDVVLGRQALGGVPVVTFFQMDKRTNGLKRIQLERPRHGVNPPAYRAISAALQADLGTPDAICEVPVRPVGGFSGCSRREVAARQYRHQRYFP